ncbi:hypothetical protein B7494_g1916 [Chlorociboria aeruginascens]|nr:hypothetical protein B7494_g1916 [Chlorociboria aeruginascens]
MPIMWHRSNLHGPFTSLNARHKWAHRVSPRYRFLSLRFTPLRIGLLLLVLGAVTIVQNGIPVPPGRISIYNATVIPHAAFQPPEPGPYRAPDMIDTFASYKFRNTCNVSSLDLHAPFSPLCADRPSLLTAMSSGGRIGHDAPYMPRGCDMRWFTSEEVCEIIGRFDRIIVIGDSMLRHVTGSINILVRKDLGYGAVTDWNFSMEERRQCFCNEQFDVKACSVQGIYKTADVVAHDSGSISCSNPINVLMEEIVKFPIPKDEIDRLKVSVSVGHATSKPIAILFGHGLWSNLELQKAVDWLDTIVDTIKSVVDSQWVGLFVTPNAAGKEKPDDWIVSQGNKALMLYEEAMGIEVAKRGIEHLGTWNMSIQSNKYDGVHLDMRGNLVKAMMLDDHGDWPQGKPYPWRTGIFARESMTLGGTDSKSLWCPLGLDEGGPP